MRASTECEIFLHQALKRNDKNFFEKGYILSYKFVKIDPQGIIKIALKYHPVSKVSALKALQE